MKTKGLMVFLLGICVAVSGCKKPATSVTTKPPAPVPRDILQQADRAFDAKDYAKAVTHYETYWQGTPVLKEQDRVLFRLGLAYSFLDSPVHTQRALAVFKELVNLHPQSPYAASAQVIVNLQEKTERLNGHVDTLNADIKTLHAQIETLNAQRETLNLDLTQKEGRLKSMDGDVAQLKRDVERLRGDVREREARIKALTNELEQLKKIDMQRRPPPASM